MERPFPFLMRHVFLPLLAVYADLLPSARAEDPHFTTLDMKTVSARDPKGGIVLLRVRSTWAAPHRLWCSRPVEPSNAAGRP